MGIEILHFGGFQDGDEVMNPAIAAHVGGAACEIGPSGLNLPTNVDNIMGLFKNNRSEDLAQQPEVNDSPVAADISATYISGGNKVRMYQASIDANPPFQFPGSAGAYAKGQLLYWNISLGRWDNAAEAGGDQSFGRITKPPASATDDLQAIMFSLNPRTP